MWYSEGTLEFVPFKLDKLLFSDTSYVCLNCFTETTMDCLSRIFVYLSISTVLLLAMSLSANAVDEPSSITYEDFGNAKNVCRSRRHHHTVKVDSECKVDITSRKCVGYCKSLTDFGLTPPYLSKHCSCCKVTKATYRIEEHECYQLDAKKKVYTGRKVMISVPYDLTCACQRCTRLVNSG